MSWIMIKKQQQPINFHKTWARESSEQPGLPLDVASMNGLKLLKPKKSVSDMLGDAKSA